MTISQSQMEAALNSLAESDEEAAILKTNLERAKVLQKRVRNRVFITGTGSVAERTAMADISDEAVKADDSYDKALLAYETLKGRRETWQIVIDVYRTLEASRRKS